MCEILVVVYSWLKGRAPIPSTVLTMHEVDDGSFAARVQAV